MRTTKGCLEAMTVLLAEGLRFQPRRLAAAVGSDFANATDVADYLVARGVPFREAYGLVATDPPRLRRRYLYRPGTPPGGGWGRRPTAGLGDHGGTDSIKEGLAAELGIQPGDKLLRINGVAPRDLIDYRILMGEEESRLDVLDTAGQHHCISLEKEMDADLGLEFSGALLGHLEK